MTLCIHESACWETKLLLFLKRLIVILSMSGSWILDGLEALTRPNLRCLLSEPICCSLLTYRASIVMHYESVSEGAKSRESEVRSHVCAQGVVSGRW